MKIKSIKKLKLDKPEPVYDIINSGSEHNFVIRCNSGNIVSHNCDHGGFTKSDRNFYYVPEGGKVVIDFGSDAAHGLGKQVFCVVGNTKIFTDRGEMYIAEVAKYPNIKVLTYSSEFGLFYIMPHDVCCTGFVYTTIQVELENGVVIEGTPEHRIMMSDGAYKELSDVSQDDKIKICTTHNIHEMGIVNIKKIIRDKPIPVYDVIEVKDTHNFISSDGVVLHNCGIMDECNFSKTGVKDVSKAKQHMQDLYNTISARIQGTFRMGGSVYGKLFAVSSKRSDSDFMEAYIETQISSGAGEHLYVADAPQWEVLPESMFSKEKFTVAVGDRYRRGFVVDTEDDAEAQRQKENELISQGYKLIHPPLDMRPKFLADFDIALRDLAGISIAGSLSFITQAAIDICKGERRNAFINDILEIGNKDKLTIEEFFHTEYVPQNLKIQPMCVHLDLSLTTDRTGISGVVVSRRKDIVGEDGKTMSQPVFAQIFSIALEAPRGDKIPYSKITSFICWLRRSGFNIQKISRDQYQSEYMAQLLEAEGFDVDKISLDRTPDGYTACRSIMLEQRIDMVDCKLLEDEMIHLQRDSITGRVDHPMGGSKDVADSFAGALWTATLTNPGVVVSIKTRSNIITSINSGRGSPQNHGVPNVISHINKLKGGR